MQVGDYVSAVLEGRATPFYGYVESIDGPMARVQPERGKAKELSLDSLRPANGAPKRTPHASICLWLTAKERDLWQARADEAGQSLSSWARNIVRKEIRG